MTKTFATTLISLACLGAAGGAYAQEMARVVSSIPVIQQVAVPQQVCTNQEVVRPGSTSGAGAVMGAVAGGAVGNAVGGGTGKAVATVLGVLGGAVLGNSIEGPGASQVQNVQNCSTQTRYENRTMGYNVTYEYAGRQYMMQTPNDPGQFIPVQVTPVLNGRPIQSTYGGHPTVRPVAAPTYAPAPIYPSQN